MKTAMQELIEWLENSSDIQNDILNWEVVKENALEKEKEQIINAHTNAYLIGEDDISVDDANEASIKYYNKTYNQNK
jgi:hypothetical protein